MEQINRAKTALLTKRVRKHQKCIIKEIKLKQFLSTYDHLHEDLPRQKSPKQHLSLPTSPRKHAPLFKKETINKRLREIVHLKKSSLKTNPFSIQKDKDNIILNGWKTFQNRHDQHFLSNWSEARKKVNEHHQNGKNFSLYQKPLGKNIKKPDDKDKDILILDEKIVNVLELVKGREDCYRYSSAVDYQTLTKQFSQSIVLDNIFNYAKHYKNLKNIPFEDFKQGKIKSYAFLHQFKDRLPKKKMQKILKENQIHM